MVKKRACLWLLAFCVACGDSSSKSSKSDNGANDTYEVEWKEGAVVLDKASLKESLENPKATDGKYRFKKSNKKAAALKDGDYVFLEGVDFVKVKGTSVDGDHVVITSEPTSLTNVLKNGKVEWARRVNFGQKTASLPLDLIRGDAPASETSSNTTEFKGKIDGLDVEYKLKQVAGNKLEMELKVEKKQGKSIIKGVAKVTVNEFRHRSSTVVEDGGAKKFVYQLEDLDVDVQLDFGGARTGKLEKKIKVPAGFDLPFVIGGIPMYLRIGGAIDFTSTLVGETSALGKTQFKLSGNPGVKVEGGKITPIGGLKSSNFKFNDGKSTGAITQGFAALLEFPKISLGIGVPRAGALETYITQKSEVVANFKIKHGAVGTVGAVPVGNCYKVDMNLAAYFGGAVRLAGFEFKKEGSIYVKKKNAVKRGSACDG